MMPTLEISWAAEFDEGDGLETRSTLVLLLCWTAKYDECDGKKEDTVYNFFRYDQIRIEFRSILDLLGVEMRLLAKTRPRLESAACTIYRGRNRANLCTRSRDVLGLNRVKLFATQVGHKIYAFYFTYQVDEAITLHEKIYSTTPTKWHSIYKQMRNQTLHRPGNQHFRTFYEIKVEARSFAVYVWEVGF